MGFGVVSMLNAVFRRIRRAAALAALLQHHLPGLLVGAGRTVHVVGTSYGGLVAYHLARELAAQEQQQRAGMVAVGKVALCSADAGKSAEDDRALAAKGGVAEVTELMAPADTKGLRRLMALCVHSPPKYIPECLLRDMLRKYFAHRREDKIALIKGITTGEGYHLTPLPQDVLIIWGEFDQIFPVEKAHKLKEKLGEKATVKVIPNTGHLPQQEDPKLFNRVLLDFFLQP
ncbi:hypothetical protein PR202_ga23348 [Eleusine coracana subsp. coracana]|uniref:AB hydrolase-1 domain-containing protein n=1 Tax=Eleusine coracana subsp. coracana TaxID=191504 RepID=A0AAV5D6L9_ELECO|nr:hypothetical protein PR202_ga23348 [Eleusine coracana subsp. coracana]